ncbi:concanavalin A-like lectin/glucanase domain-containing protein [Amylocystis lapponica]|nr:concanavalin A-like lectin/glucanase domain-containing protein [Amylocystis lapponica]
MYLSIPLLLFLLANVAPADAHLLSRGSESIVRVASQVRHRAVKRTVGLLKDIRLAYTGLVLQQQQGGNGQYCLPLNTSLTGGNSSSSSSPSGSSSASTPIATGGTVASSPWKLAQSYEGNTFFNGWSFFTWADPTDGNVRYVDQGTAQANNLTSLNSAGNAVMRVETTPQVQGNRASVRITTDYSYTGGLVILDAVHMPTGCGTWPAFWSNGPNWPAGGEIDIVEGVNTYTNNQATLHTSDGCAIPSTNATALAITGALIDGTDCSVAGTGDAGCGVRATQANTFGSAFNGIGGGVYAMQWTNSGISMYFFPRSAIPSDISAGAPFPATWGLPMASFPASTCDPATHFYDHSIIFDTTFCGAWAGGNWAGAGVPGLDQSCAQITGTASCAEYVQNNGAAFAEAYWEVKSVKIYR